METSELIDLIVGEVRKGRGFLPVIGAGFSAAAGIPVISEVCTYLRYCIKKVVEKNWHPRGDRWPDRNEAFDKPILEPKLVTYLLKKYKCETKKARQVIILAAIGALNDWREMLHFLSRLSVDPSTAADEKSGQEEKALKKLKLGPPAGTVVDSLFDHLTSGHEPGLGHTMLAHLADGLRIRTILTTNFDSLIENAFDRIAMPLEVFEVQRRSEMPETPLLLESRSLIKMHGGKYNRRADYSLDELPSDMDKRTFRKYLNDPWADGQDTSRYILVFGISGNDYRIIGLLANALHEQTDLKIIWVCFGDEEPTQVRGKFSDYLKILGDSSKKTLTRLITKVARDTGHLLFELFQHLYCSMPPAGADFPALHRVAPELYPDPKKKIYKWKKLENQKNTIRTKLQEMVKDPDSADRLLVYDGEPGVSSVAAAIFDEFSGLPKATRDTTHCHCIWIDLDYCFNVEHFRAILVDAIAQKLGLSSNIPPLSEFSDEACKECITRLTRQSPIPVVVFINGRDGPGINAVWQDPVKSGEGHTEWGEPKQPVFWKCIKFLKDAGKLSMVVLCWSNNNERQRLEKPDDIEPIKCSEPCHTLNARDVVEEVVNWLKNDEWMPEPDTQYKIIRDQYHSEQFENINERRKRFVYALTLMRRSRHPAATFSWAFTKALKRGAFQIEGPVEDVDNDRKRYILSRAWLQELQKFHVGRSQQGGCFWMHDTIRCLLQEKFPELKKDRALIHQGIGDWYLKLFRASNDPSAALESIYHRLCCFKHEPDSNGTGENLAHTSVLAAIETLEMARPEIIARGHVRASVNLLESLEGVCKKANSSMLNQLGLECQTLRRDYYNEIACFTEVNSINDSRLNTPLASESKSVNDCVSSSTAEGKATSIKHKRSLGIYWRAVAYMGMRNNDEAWKNFISLLDELHLFNEKVPSPIWPIRSKKEDWDKIFWEMRQNGWKWANERKDNQNEIQLAVRTLQRFMFLVMLRAQVKTLNENTIEPAIPAFIYAEGLYTLATSIMRHVQDNDFIQVQNAYLRTNVSVALARLGRFTEAYRRLHEASGYLAASHKSADPLPWAVIDLRRAEVYLERFEYKKKEPKAHALLDRAQNSLDRANQRLIKHPTDVWWRTLYYELQLRLLECNHRDKPSRPSDEEDKDIKGLYEKGKVLIASDTYRLARYLDVCSRMGIKIENAETDLKEREKDKQDDEVKNYVAKVHDVIKKN